MELKSYLKKSKKRIESIISIFEKEELKLSFDKLETEKIVDHEVLYKNLNDEESELLFVFGFDFFEKELEDQEFKKMINQNSLNFKVLKAYYDISKKKKEVLVSDILNQIQDKEKDSLQLHQFLKKILTQAYYMGWKLEKKNCDIDSIDYSIEIPKNFLVKVKQRFNFDIVSQIYENDNLFIFLNAKSKLMLIFKNRDMFTKVDILKEVNPVLKEIFGVNEVILN